MGNYPRLSGEVFGAALVATAFAIAGFIVGFFDSTVANALCSSSNLAGCQQVQNIVYVAYGIGAAALFVAVILWVIVLKYS